MKHWTSVTSASAVQAVRAELSAGGVLVPFRSVSLRLAPTDEAAVAPALEALRAEFDGGVAVGSYPVLPFHTFCSICSFSLQGMSMPLQTYSTACTTN